MGGIVAAILSLIAGARQFLTLTAESAERQNISVPQGQTFASVVDKVLPVLYRGALEASGPRVGDLYAHVGWGYFLKRRDGQAALDPASWYVKALEADPANPYAHAFWGHWKIWSNEPVDAAMAEFAKAIASNRERAFVRGVQVSALLNRSSSDARLELVKVANDMRKNDEPIDGRLLREIRGIYHAALRDEPLTDRLMAGLPASE